MDIETIISTVIGVIIGGIITWITSRYYYQRSGKELKEEAGKIRSLNTMILESLEQAGLAEIARDESGKIIGLKRLNIHPQSVEVITMVDELTLKVNPPNEH